MIYDTSRNVFQQVRRNSHFFPDNLMKFYIVNCILQLIGMRGFLQVSCNLQVNHVVAANESFFWQTTMIGIQADGM